MTTNRIYKKYETWTDKLNKKVNDKYWARWIGEFLSSFFFIFIINLVVALGEDGIIGFRFFYNYNFGMGVWIGFMTMVGFVWATRTSLSVNIVNLAIAHRRKEINNASFWTSIPVQFLGGICGSIFVYAVAGNLILENTNTLHTMGGATPKLKGLVSTNVSADQVSWINPWQSINFAEKFGDTNKGYVYSYAVIQGFINGAWILVAFILNSIVDHKSNNRTKQLGLRYIILIVGISFTTIFNANTTNWVRLLTPVIVNVIVEGGQNHTLLILHTSLVYIAVQFIAIAIMYSEIIWTDAVAEKNRKLELEKMNEEIN